MRIIFSSIILIQMSVSSIAAEVGQIKEFSAKDTLIKTMVKVEAEEFYKIVKSNIDKANAEGTAKFIEGSPTLSPEEKETFKKLIDKSEAKRPNLYEVSPGVWQAKYKKYTVSISIEDLYEGKLKINGQVFNFKDIPASELETNILDFAIALERTSFWRVLINRTIGIESAEAAIFVHAMAVVAAVALGYALYKWKYQPEQTVTKLNEIKNKLAAESAACEEAGSNSQKYTQTYQLASSIGDQSVMSSTSPQNALEHLIQKHISNGEGEDCYQTMHSAGKKLKVDIPLLTPGQKQQAEIDGIGSKVNKKTDKVGALYEMCSAYDRLTSCMSGFVQTHINNSDVKGFKDKAKESFEQYQRKGSGPRTSKQ